MVSKVIPLLIAFCIISYLVLQYTHYPAKTEYVEDYLETNLSTKKVTISNLDDSS